MDMLKDAESTVVLEDQTFVDPTVDVVPMFDEEVKIDPEVELVPPPIDTPD